MTLSRVKNKFLQTFWFLLSSILILLLENFLPIKDRLPSFLSILILLTLIATYIFINIHPDLTNKIKNPRLHHLAGGLFLIRLFLFTTIACIFIIFYPYLIDPDVKLKDFAGYFALYKTYYVIHIIWVFIVELVLFWNAIIRIYIYSRQLGVKMRIIGAVCGMIPVVHLFVLFKIIRIIDFEVQLESEKEELNERRKDKQICKTRYPIVMIHGVFFRDFKYFNYWGRIPLELEKNGATIYYGNHESANSVAKSGQQLAKRIKEIMAETGSEKVNIIAHSKGGLDCRYMIKKCGMEDYVASLTTINTPHRGCEFADYLLNGKVPESTKKLIAAAYNTALKNFGDKEPDFIASVTDLTSSTCRMFNEQITDSAKVFYQSVGSKLNVPKGGRFPLNYSYHLVKRFDGPNDGLVGEKSFEWGSRFTMLTTSGIRGISHGDMIDLNRENIRGFDVREFYVQLVSDLREKGF